MDFQFYKKMALSKAREMRKNIVKATEDVMSTAGSKKSNVQPGDNMTQQSTEPRHMSLSLDVEIFAPIIIIPRSPFTSNTTCI